MEDETLNIECDICGRDDFSKVGINCQTCARTVLYPLRLDAARLMLDKSALSHQVDESTNISAAGKTGGELTRAWKAESTKTDIGTTKERVEDQKSRITSLREEVAMLKEEIAQSKSSIKDRRDHLHTITTELPSRRAALSMKHKNTLARGTKSFSTLSAASIETRAYLCREAASLLKLRLRKPSKKHPNNPPHYLIAGYIIPDLRHITRLRCNELTAVLSIVSHLISLIAFYLGLKPPAEFTLPHRDYPLPTINTPESSYTKQRKDFPGFSSNLSAGGSPSSSRHSHKALPDHLLSRPRPLFIGSDDHSETVASMSTRDPAAFRFFLEGISLLAWNISWISASQGFTVGTQSWELACDIGHNLYHLIFAPLQSPALQRVLSSKDARHRSPAAKARDRNPNSPSPSTTPNSPAIELGQGQLGSYTHLTPTAWSGSNPANPSFPPMLRLTGWQSISMSLREHLQNDIKNADWELLGDDEVDDGGERFDEGQTVVVGGRRNDLGARPAARGSGGLGTGLESVMSLVSMAGKVVGETAGREKGRGTSGWTKVKNRET